MKDETKKRLRLLGFGDHVDRVEKGQCAFCGSPIKYEDFSDQASCDEFELSGLCQVCQDKTFEEI
jgi:hypothetical protein